MENDDERSRIDAEHQHYLNRMRIAIRQRLTARGRSEEEIERHLSSLPAEPICVIAQRMMAMAAHRVQRTI